MAEFKVGDLVQLKSGGPKMTVVSINDDAGVVYECQWFINNSDLKKDYFVEGSIKYFEPFKAPTPRHGR